VTDTYVLSGVRHRIRAGARGVEDWNDTGRWTRAGTEYLHGA
jgi:hypothetical protein